MKKIIGLLLVSCLMLSVGITTFASDTIYVTLDGSYIEFDVRPQIINGRTMVPIRAIFEKMGATVEWDSSTSSAICTNGDTVVKMTVNSMDMYINNQVTKMDISPVVIDGRTLAPARYVAEAFGADVQWDQDSSTVIIHSHAKNNNSTTNINLNQAIPTDNQEETVYIGETGSKYHYKTCRTLKNGAFPISLDEALAQGRTACKICH